MINWTPYLKSICKKYAEWWDVYTLTDVEGKTRLPKTGPLLEDFWVQEIKREREKPEEREKLEEREKSEEREEKRERFTVLEGLRKYADNHVLLRGRPGSGKSTSLARLLLEESEANLGPLPQPLSYKERGVQYQLSATSEKFKEVEPPPASGGLRGVKIPILIELRFYETSIFDLILQFLQRHELSIDKNDLENLLLGNHDFTLLLLFDGINELPSEPARQDLQKFRQQYHKIPMIFTTRDIGGGDLNIEKKLEMLPLNEAQMRDFVKNYLPEKGEQMLKQLGGRLREFGETPLLLWMLCSVFNGNNNQIPANLGLVFRRFTKIYDHKLKDDVPTYNQSRDWWRELLQVLAWKMTEGDSKTEIQVAISRREAETIFREYLQGKIEYPDNCAKQWLKDLLKHHLIQLESNEQIVFRHQLIQEYYTAEALLEKLPHLRDEELQWDYLNYLKWTEPVALMLGLLDNETQAKRVVKLGLEIDLKLGARLAGEVKVELQKQTVELVLELDVPKQFEVELLGLTKSNEVVNELSQALEDSNQYVRRNAVEALLKISPEAAIPGLLKALEHSDWTVRRNAAYALGKIGSEAAVPGLVKALEDPNKNVRSNAVCALGKIGTEAAISELVKALRNSNEDVRGTATYVLGRIDSKTVIAELVKALEDSNEDVRSNAAKALGNIGSKVAIPRLVKALEDSDWYVRSNAVEALGKIGSKTAIPELVKALKDSDCNVRSNAVEALGKIGSKTAIPELVKALEDPDEYVRSNAVEDSGNIGSEAAIPELVKALENSDWYVRENAVEALGKIGSEVAMAQLIKCLKNPDFVESNDADTLSKVREALDIIQNKLKYYHPLSQPMNQQIYISYNWNQDSNEMANQLVQAFEAKGIEVIRDETHTNYKDSIKNFMQQIGQGKCVIAVISDSYLKSKNCMFELVQIAKNGNFYDRIFPIVLKDARIYNDLYRIDYLKYWDDEKAKLQAEYKKIDLANTNSILDTLNLYDEIRRNIDNLTNIIKDMNTLNLDLHRASEFAAMIQAVETKLAENS